MEEDFPAAAWAAEAAEAGKLPAAVAGLWLRSGSAAAREIYLLFPVRKPVAGRRPQQEPGGRRPLPLSWLFLRCCFDVISPHREGQGKRRGQSAPLTVLSRSASPVAVPAKTDADLSVIPKSIFSTIADSSALDCNSAILYGEAPGIFEYYKDSRISGCKHSVSLLYNGCPCNSYRYG